MYNCNQYENWKFENESIYILEDYQENKYINCDRCVRGIYSDDEYAKVEYHEYEKEKLCIECLEATDKTEIKNIEYKFY